MAADSASSALSEADPLHPIPNDGVDEFILKAENWTLVPEIADENGTLRALVDPKYLPRPRAPQAPAVPQITVPSRLDKLYAPHFRRLELDLEARIFGVPASVTERRVATLGLVSVSAEGEAAFEPTLEHQYGVDKFINAFRKDENWPLVPELADENGTLRVLVDPKYLPRPRAPQAPVVPQITVPSRLDELYAPHFRRLELDLEARCSHLPAFVTEGRVATLGLVSVSADGEAIFEPTLEDHVAAPAK